MGDGKSGDERETKRPRSAPQPSPGSSSSRPSPAAAPADQAPRYVAHQAAMFLNHSVSSRTNPHQPTTDGHHTLPPAVYPAPLPAVYLAPLPAFYYIPTPVGHHAPPYAAHQAALSTSHRVSSRANPHEPTTDAHRAQSLAGHLGQSPSVSAVPLPALYYVPASPGQHVPLSPIYYLPVPPGHQISGYYVPFPVVSADLRAPNVGDHQPIAHDHHVLSSTRQHELSPAGHVALPAGDHDPSPLSRHVSPPAGLPKSSTDASHVPSYEDHHAPPAGDREAIAHDHHVSPPEEDGEEEDTFIPLTTAIRVPSPAGLETFRNYLRHMSRDQVRVAVNGYWKLIKRPRKDGFFKFDEDAPFISYEQTRFYYAMWVALVNRNGIVLDFDVDLHMYASWVQFLTSPYVLAVAGVFESERVRDDEREQAERDQQQEQEEKEQEQEVKKQEQDDERRRQERGRQAQTRKRLEKLLADCGMI